jgi:prepilin-type N-terminal cleavage/methylation domain-containing protein
MRRRGFTLIEIMVAMVLIVIIATTFARFAASYSRAMRDATLRLTQATIASSRLELVRADPRYTQLAALYGSGAGADTTGVANYPLMRRRTFVSRSTSTSRDRTTVTVQVTYPNVPDTVSVTAVIASP